MPKKKKTYRRKRPSRTLTALTPEQTLRELGFRAGQAIKLARFHGISTAEIADTLTEAMNRITAAGPAARREHVQDWIYNPLLDYVVGLESDEDFSAQWAVESFASPTMAEKVHLLEEIGAFLELQPWVGLR